MNRFLLSLSLLVSAAPTCSAQRVLYTSQTATEPYTGPAIRTVRPHWALSPTIKVVYADGSKQAIAKDSIWGYVDRRNRVYRCYKHEFYKVVEAGGELVRYSIQRSTGRGIANVRYFSQTLDSPIRWTKAKARRDSTEPRQSALR